MCAYIVSPMIVNPNIWLWHNYISDLTMVQINATCVYLYIDSLIPFHCCITAIYSTYLSTDLHTFLKFTIITLTPLLTQIYTVRQPNMSIVRTFPIFLVFNPYPVQTITIHPLPKPSQYVRFLILPDPLSVWTVLIHPLYNIYWYFNCRHFPNTHPVFTVPICPQSKF